MKKSTFVLSLFLFFSTQALGETGCFIVKEKDHILVQEGNCSKRNAPCSTFKIAISLMGFDSGLLMDETHPVSKCREEYKLLLPVILDAWKKPQNPSAWIKNSCLWYSQIITQKLGHRKLASFEKSVGRSVSIFDKKLKKLSAYRIISIMLSFIISMTPIGTARVIYVF